MSFVAGITAGIRAAIARVQAAATAAVARLRGTGAPGTFQPASFFSEWEDRVLTNLEQAGPLAQHTVAFLRAKKIRFSAVQPSAAAGASWHVLGARLHAYITFGQALRAADDPWSLSSIVHEAKHLEQGPLTALSVYGELEAWQLGWNVYKALPGAGPVDPAIEQVLALPLNDDLQNLQVAQAMMQQAGGPTYQIYRLPLRPPRIWDLVCPVLFWRYVSPFFRRRPPVKA